jgi:hypothetical protein
MSVSDVDFAKKEESILKEGEGGKGVGIEGGEYNYILVEQVKYFNGDDFFAGHYCV